MLVSVVIPCYNSAHTIGKVVELVSEQFDQMQEYTCEFVLVNDCSADDTYAVIRELGRKYPNVRGINLMRNFGQHNALMCAMNYAEGDLVLGMDDDMQTHPSQIPIILNKIREGYDVVYGVYEKRLNSPIKNFTSWLNKVTSRALLGRPKDIVSSNYWVITRQVRDEVIKYKNYNPYVDAIFFRVTHNIGNVPIEHHKREYGSSNYTLGKLIKLWMAYWNYSMLPLRIATVIGSIMAVIGIVSGVVLAISKMISPSMTVGWASIVCILLVFFGIVLLVLGVMGEYIGDIVLSINSTPQYVVRETVNLKDRNRKRNRRYEPDQEGDRPRQQNAGQR